MNPAETFNEAIRRYQAGDPAGALLLCDALIAAAASHPEIWQLGGLAAFALGRFSDAADRFGLARVLDPNNAAHAVNLANVLIELDRDGEAARKLALAVELNPNSPDAEIGLGLVARRAGRLEDAVAHADRALRLKPNSYQALVDRGRDRRVTLSRSSSNWISGRSWMISTIWRARCAGSIR